MAPSQNTRSRVQSPPARKPLPLKEDKPDAKKAPVKPIEITAETSVPVPRKSIGKKEAPKKGMSKIKAAAVFLAIVALVAGAAFAVYKAADLPWAEYKATFEKAIAPTKATVEKKIAEYASKAAVMASSAKATAAVSLKAAYVHAEKKAKAEPLLAGAAAAIAALPMVFIIGKKVVGKLRKAKAA